MRNARRLLPWRPGLAACSQPPAAGKETHTLTSLASKNFLGQKKKRRKKGRTKARNRSERVTPLLGEGEGFGADRITPVLHPVVWGGDWKGDIKD